MTVFFKMMAVTKFRVVHQYLGWTNVLLYEETDWAVTEFVSFLVQGNNIKMYLKRIG
jgi:hypothetical protein